MAVEVEERRGGMATCDRSTRQHPERVTTPLMSTLDKTVRAPDGRCQGEFMVTNNRTTTTPIIPLPKVQVHGGVSTDDDQDAKLTVCSAWPGMRKMEHLIGFLCHLQVQRPKL